MESVREKMEKFADSIRENGYPKRYGENNFGYRLQDEYFNYDLFDDNDKDYTILIVGIDLSEENAIPIWGAFYKGRKFMRFLSTIMIRRRKK